MAGKQIRMFDVGAGFEISYYNNCCKQPYSIYEETEDVVTNCMDCNYVKLI